MRWQHLQDGTLIERNTSGCEFREEWTSRCGVHASVECEILWTDFPGENQLHVHVRSLEEGVNLIINLLTCWVA